MMGTSLGSMAMLVRGALAQNRTRVALSVLAIALGVALGYAVQLINAAAVGELAQGVKTLAGAEPIAAAQVDFAILVGEEMRALATELGKQGARSLHNALTFAHCDSPAEAIGLLENYGITAGDAVLVKGSNSIGLGQVVAHFSGQG